MTDAQLVKIAWASPYKAPTVLIGATLVTDASRVTVDCVAGEPPKIFLEFAEQPVEDLNLEGVVHVVKEVAADPLEAVGEFLDAIDPAELDRCVLAAMEMGGPQTYGAATVEAMKGWARGD
jgi:hypothetical protein